MFHLFAGDGEGPAAAAGGRGGAWARGGPPCSKYGLPSDVLARITSGLCCCCLNCFAKRRRAHSGAAGGRAGRAALRGKGLHCPSAVLPLPFRHLLTVLPPSFRRPVRRPLSPAVLLQAGYEPTPGYAEQAVTVFGGQGGRRAGGRGGVSVCVCVFWGGVGAVLLRNSAPCLSVKTPPFLAVLQAAAAAAATNKSAAVPRCAAAGLSSVSERF